VFHVTSQQLREAQGWVRCGICQEVFGAHAHALADASDPAVDPSLVLRRETVADSSTHTPGQDASRRVRTTNSSRQRRSKQTRWGWLVSATLGLALLTQIGFHQRHRLAEQFPFAAAWFQSWCETPSCSLRTVQDITITDSSFHAPDASHFQLSAVLSNRSKLTLDAPSLVLALTDSADRVVIRKVYGPSQWGASASTLAPQSTWPVVLWIAFDSPEGGPPIVGYRLKAIYP
jgi:hypothetical protein